MRPSNEIYRSRTTTLLNAEVGRKTSAFRISVELSNLMNRREHDIDYEYVSQIAPTATPKFTDVFHPIEPFQARTKIKFTPDFRH
jgi:hypothetical protein